MISAAWGLGEAVVGGIVTPDTVVVDKETRQVVSREVADKQVMTVRVDGTTETQGVPESLRRAGRAGRRHRGRTRCGWEAKSRRCTASRWTSNGRSPTARSPSCRPGPSRPCRYRSPQQPTSIVDAAQPQGDVRPRQPGGAPAQSGLAAIWHPGSALANVATGALGTEFLGTEAANDYQYRTINGYVYLGIVFGPKEMWKFTKAGISQIGMMLGRGTERWQEARRLLIDASNKWEARPVQSLSPSELLTGAGEVLLEAARFYTVIQSGTLPTASSSEILFTRFYDMLVKRNGDPEATTFLFGFDTVTCRREVAVRPGPMGEAGTARV